MNRFFRNVGVLAVAEMIARLKGVVILPVLTRHLGPVDFGVWSQVSMIALLLAPVLSLGAEHGILRMLPGLPTDEQYRKFMAWFIAALGGALLFGFLLILSSSSISRIFFANPDYQQFISLAAASLLTVTIVNAVRAWLRIQNNAIVLAALTVAQAVLSLVAVVLGVVLHCEVFGLVVLTLLGDLVLGLVATAWIVRRHGWRWPEFGVLLSAARFGLPLVPTAYALWGLNWMDRLFLVHYQSIEAIGIYSAAYGLGSIVIQVFVSPVWVLYPNTAAELHNRGDVAGLDRLLHSVSYGMLILSVPAVAGLYVLSEPLIGVVAGAEFRSGALVIPIVAMAYLFLMLSAFGDVALGLWYKQKWATASAFLALAANLVLNLLLIPGFGILGAAWATAGAFLVQLMFSTAMATRYGPLWRSFSGLYRIVAAALLMALLVRMLDQMTSFSDLVRLGVFAPVGAVIYGVAAVIFGVVSRDYLKTARSWLPQRDR